MTGELIYVSERKLRQVALHLGISGPHFSKQLALEVDAGLTVPLAPIADVSARVTGRVERADDRTVERRLERTLSEVVAALERDGLPDLDVGEGKIFEGGWFHFHRDLNFGVGASDDDQSIRALVLVDQEPLDEGGIVPGLLMHGSMTHVLDPYRPDDVEALPGARSGSGTGTLFAWAKRTSAMIDDAAIAELGPLEAAVFDARPRRAAESAVDMYRLFAQEDWMARLPQLAHPAPCDGIARATFIAVDGESTVVMGTPLYVRMCPLADMSEEAAPVTSTGLLARLFNSRRIRPPA